MKPLIINVRGTSGSGKTTLTREWRDTFHSVRPILLPSGGAVYPGAKPDGYLLGRRNEEPSWFLVGSYENTCGGCDTIKTQAEIINRVEWATSRGYSVWLEGLILSTIYGSVGEYSEKFGERWLFCYMDTPVDVCLTRVLARRSQAGNSKVFNPVNTRARHATIERNRTNTEGRGRRTERISHTLGLKAIQHIIRRAA